MSGFRHVATALF